MDIQRNNAKKILVVEDETSLAVGLEFNLTEEGYLVVIAADGQKALETLDEQEFDLIILDIMLPLIDGFEVARKIRSESITIPILILTARTSPADRILGLEIGADDYLNKPFHLEELLLRVKGMLRRRMLYRNNYSCDNEYSFGNNKINFIQLTCVSGRKTFRITPLEAALLKYFVQNRERIVTREELLDQVWHINSESETRTVDNFIVRLRKYFEEDPGHPVYFNNIRGRGYIFSPGNK